MISLEQNVSIIFVNNVNVANIRTIWYRKLCTKNFIFELWQFLFSYCLGRKCSNTPGMSQRAKCFHIPKLYTVAIFYFFTLKVHSEAIKFYQILNIWLFGLTFKCEWEREPLQEVCTSFFVYVLFLLNYCYIFISITSYVWNFDVAHNFKTAVHLMQNDLDLIWQNNCLCDHLQNRGFENKPVKEFTSLFSFYVKNFSKNCSSSTW